MLTTSSIIIAVIGLIVWVIRYLISRNNNIEGRNAQSTIDKIRKGNDAASDNSYDDELRKKYDR